jgi:hypothetical protein
MVKGIELHSIIEHIFGDVKGLGAIEQIQVNCPRCSESNYGEPDGKFNMDINTEKRVFRCWRCDPKFSGSIKRLIKLYGTTDDLEMYESLADSYNYTEYDGDYEYEEIEEILVQLPKEMIYFKDMDVHNMEHFEAYNYIVNERKINREIILKYKLGFCIDGKYNKRIIIPSYDIDNKINYFVARNYDTANKKKKPYENPKANKNQIIFNAKNINYDSTVYLCEGVFEMLSFPVNTVPMLGKTIGTALFMKLKELKPDVVILLDPDAYKNAIELFYQINCIYVGCEERVRIVKLPNNDDLDELRRYKGVEEVIKCLRTARSLTVDDYFISNLQKPYDNAGRNSYQKYFEWKKRS